MVHCSPRYSKHLFWAPQWGAPGLSHGPVRAQIVVMSQAVCQFACSTSSAFGTDFVKLSQARRWFRCPRGGPQGPGHFRIRAQIAGMSQAVCLSGGPDSFAFRADCWDVSSEVVVSTPQGGAARGYDTRPFAPRLWGCLRRFACLHAQHPLLSEQFVRMSQARRWFQHSQGGATRVGTLQDSRPDCGDV